MKQPTYKELQEGARYIPNRFGYTSSSIIWRVWDRETKEFGRSFTTKRLCQNYCDELNGRVEE